LAKAYKLNHQIIIILTKKFLFANKYIPIVGALPQPFNYRFVFLLFPFYYCCVIQTCHFVFVHILYYCRPLPPLLANNGARLEPGCSREKVRNLAEGWRARRWRDALCLDRRERNERDRIEHAKERARKPGSGSPYPHVAALVRQPNPVNVTSPASHFLLIKHLV
jgi:hypothetical protein